MKRKSSRAQQSNDSHPASLYFYGRHELRKNNDNSCWNFTKDYFSSKSLSRRDTSFKCYSREKPYSSRERYSRSSTVCSVCGRLGHYKKDVLWNRVPQVLSVYSTECPLRRPRYSSGRSSDRIKRHKWRTEDRKETLLYSSRHEYEDKRSVSDGTIEFASHGNIIDSHYDSLFVKRPSSIQVNRYDRVAKPVLLFIYRTLLSTEKGCGDYQ